MKKLLIALVLILAMVAPDVSFAKGFSSSGGSHSSSFSSSSRSSSSSSYSRPSSSSYSSNSSRSSSSSRPKVNLSKSSTSFSTTKKGSFSGGSSSKSYSSSNRRTTTSGSFSGRTSTKSTSYRTGTVYRSTPTRMYYGGHYISVSHYYHVGYSPFGWYGYYSGFSTGMFMGSLYHPWGGVYRVNGGYTDYGPSPIAWIADIIIIGMIIIIAWVVVRAFRKPKTTFTRKF